jgi:hypothetical protein
VGENVSVAGDTKWTRPFYFVQGADLQMGMIQSYLEKNPIPGWEKEIELGERAVAIVNEMRPKPKFFVMCGDLCHAFPGKNVNLSKPLTVFVCIMCYKQATWKLCIMLFCKRG